MEKTLKRHDVEVVFEEGETNEQTGLECRDSDQNDEPCLRLIALRPPT